MSFQRPAPSFPRVVDEAVPSPPPDFERFLSAHNLEIPADQRLRLGQFVSLLTRANRVMNLTAIRDPDDVWMKVVADSLTLVPQLREVLNGSHVLDLGCGAGIPGLVLAIVFPHLQFTLVDATAKKIAFVSHVAAELSLSNVRARSGRAETLAASGQGELRECFDRVVARAVAPLRVLLELASPFARAPSDKSAGGQLLLVKGQGATEELTQARTALKELHLRHLATQDTPTGKLLSFEKCRPTPQRYPRANGVPKRQPL